MLSDDEGQTADTFQRTDESVFIIRLWAEAFAGFHVVDVRLRCGLPLFRESVERGGVEGGEKLKAVQIGGPSGGCIPAELCDAEVDFDALNQMGAIMGSGGLVVLGESSCMVDVARYFTNFTCAESCGKCTFCRVGIRRMLDILERFTTGQATMDDIDRLEELVK